MNIAYEEIKCRSGVNKVSWADWTGMVLCRLAGKSGQGRVFLLALEWPTSQFCYIYCVEFGRGKKLETALLSLSILWKKDIISNIFNLNCSFLRFPPAFIKREASLRIYFKRVGFSPSVPFYP